MNRDVASSKGGWIPSRRISIGYAVGVVVLSLVAGAFSTVREPGRVIASVEPSPEAPAGAQGEWESCKTAASSWWMAPLPENGDPKVAMSGTSVSPVEDHCADETDSGQDE